MRKLTMSQEAARVLRNTFDGESARRLIEAKDDQVKLAAAKVWKRMADGICMCLDGPIWQYNSKAVAVEVKHRADFYNLVEGKTDKGEVERIDQQVALKLNAELEVLFLSEEAQTPVAIEMDDATYNNLLREWNEIDHPSGPFGRKATCEINKAIVGAEKA